MGWIGQRSLGASSSPLAGTRPSHASLPQEEDSHESQGQTSVYSIFAPGAEIKWTAETASSAMRDFVEQREIIL